MINPKITRQMEKQPNQLLWHGIFLLLVLAAIFGIYKAVQAVDYTWRWERIPQYIAYQAEQKQYAEFDGTVVTGTTAAEKGQLFLQDDLDPNRRQAIASTGAQVAEGDTVFLGDTLDVQLSWTAGPIAWGVWVTVKLSLVAGVFAILLGTLAGLARLSPNPALRNLAVTYVELIRGTPLLVQILILFYVVANAFGVDDRYLVGVVALSLFAGAYLSEMIRAGIESIRDSQLESARAIGLTPAQTYRYVIFPQVVRQLIPPLTGQFASIIKDSSLLSIIAVSEFTLNAQEVNAFTYSTLESYLPLAVGYLLLTLPISLVSRILERKFHYAT